VRGTVRLAAFPTAAAAFVPAAIARSRAEHPDLRGILSELETDEAVAAAARQALHSAEIGMIHRRPPM
jgi:DNA-binding transcriptional LysR family regulator